MSDQKLKIFYCGLDPLTLSLLTKNKSYNVCGIADFDDFNQATPKNLFDKLFKYVYKLRKRNSIFVKFFAFLYYICHQLSSYSFCKSTSMLMLLCNTKSKILDLSNPEEVELFFKRQKIDLTIVNNWWLLPESFLDLPKYGVINLHPSLLPKYRGSLPTLWSLKNKDHSSALSFIKLNKNMDQGEIIEQIEFSIIGDNSISVEKKIEKITTEHLYGVIDRFVKNGFVSKQNNSQVSYTAKYHDYMEIKAAEENGSDIVNKINLYPYLWPFDFCYLRTGEQKYSFTKAELLDQLPQHLNLDNPWEYIHQNKVIYIKSKDNRYIKGFLLNSDG